MFLELFIGLITALFIWDYVNKRRRNKIYEENGFKAVPTLPIIGSIHHFLNVTPETVFEDFSSKCYQYGRTYYLWEFGEASIFTIDVELIEAVLSNNQIITKNSDYDLLNDWIGGGLLLSTGKKWHQHRKILTPTFHFKILEQFVEVFDRQFRKMIEKLKETADGKTIVDVYPKFCLTALDIITETAMGVSVNAQEKPEFPYAKAVSTAADIILKRSITPGLRYDFIMRLVAPTEFKALNESIKITHDFGNKVIKERREALEKSIAEESTKAVDDDQNDVGTKKRMALLDLLLQANIDGKPLTNEEIRQEVDTFMFAGHDTTTTATSHILYLLSRHPEVQQKLFEEICSVFGNDKEREIKMHDLNELRYMECVIKEGLRIHAPASTIGRYTDEDIVLKNGTLIPAKTNVGILIYHVLKDPLNFPEPEAFKPERFEASSDVKINPFAYIPFSAGPRNCIGQKFAMLEMKTALSLILMNFELLPLGEKVRPFMSVVTRSANGCQMGFKPRNY